MRRILLFFLLIGIFHIDAFCFVQYVTANLNLRYGSSVQYGVIDVIPKGTAVTIDEDCYCKWVPVEYNGQIGYVSTKDLSSFPQKRKMVNGRGASYSDDRTIRYYTNSYRNRVQSPTYYNARPRGATALCRDGTI